jgi:hypothetical protein
MMLLLFSVLLRVVSRAFVGVGLFISAMSEREERADMSPRGNCRKRTSVVCPVPSVRDLTAYLRYDVVYPCCSKEAYR